MHTSATLFRSLNSLVRPIVESGLTTPLPIGTGIVMVETTGRTSGKPRRVPLVAMRFGNRVFVSTVRADSQWMRNLAATPSAKVRLFGHDRDATSTLGHVGEFRFAALRLDA